MPTYVMDSSAMIKLVVDEPGSEWMQAWWRDHAGAPKAAPVLLYYETGRALQQGRPALAPADLPQIHADLVANIALEPLPHDNTLDWDSTRALTFYDACYLALARRHGAIVTADRRLADAARSIGVESVAEVPSRPGSD